MYHVSDDVRVQKSAKLICEGLGKCMEEKPFDKIKISDIYEKSFVSRATFYRLFDSKTDVLSYECDKLMSERAQTVEHADFSNKLDLAIYSINLWLSHKTLIKAIVENHLYWILYETHRKNADILKKIYNLPYSDEKQLDYFVANLTSLICCTLSVYFMHGANEPIEEVYRTVCQCNNIIAEAIALKR